MVRGLMKVRATGRMSTEDFTAHINARHAQEGEIADLARVEERSIDSDRGIWEAYHKLLHKKRSYEHEHGE